MDVVPVEVVNLANVATENLLPIKSKDRYMKVYSEFIDWKNEKKVSITDENVLLAYLNKLSEKFSPNTLWSLYSMLRSTIELTENVDITKFNKLKCFLKSKSKSYIPKKAKILSEDQILEFLTNAPDQEYLCLKVIMIMGFCGCMRRHEIYDMELSWLDDRGNRVLMVSIPPLTKNDKPRKFAVSDEFYDFYKNYHNLRPENCKFKKFFLQYQDGKCQRQVVGINSIGNAPKKIVQYLNLQNHDLYTGHCFRRSSATTYVTSGGEITGLKMHGGWKSTACAEGYIEESEALKKRVGSKLSSEIFEKFRFRKQETITSNNIPAPLATDVVLPSFSADRQNIHTLALQQSVNNTLNADLHNPETIGDIIQNAVFQSTGTPSQPVNINQRSGAPLNIQNCQFLNCNINFDVKKM